MIKRLFLYILIITASLAGSQMVWAKKTTLTGVLERGFLQCGINPGLPGFSNPDQNGNWSGMDVDFCRVVAAAVLGDANKVKFVPLTAKERFTALQSGEIDLLSRNTTWTLSRDTTLGINFAGTFYYDGQAFMVSRDLGVKSARELDGAAICILSGTTTELNVADYFRQHKMQYQPIVFDTADQVVKGFEGGRCDVMSSDQSQLYALRIKLAKPDKAIVLPELISKEPLGPLVRQGDDQWFNIVKWSLFAIINAEDLKLTSSNIANHKNSQNPLVRRFIGLDGTKGKGIDLKADWAYQIVSQVGNYAEIFNRNIGEQTPLKIQRGKNALWSDGGLLYAPPFR